MSYLGNTYLNQQNILPATDFFSGNGVTTTFTLSRPVLSNYAVAVVVNNVQQNPLTAYSINNSNQIVLTGAPSTGTNNIYVNYNAIQAQVLAQPSQGTVNTAQLGVVNSINSYASNFTLSINGNNAITITSSTTATTFAGAVSASGNILPTTDGVYNIGSASLRWLNIYTGDLHLSNEAHETGNSIDGTKGNWTIQEGETDLYIINNNNGKRYKIKLEEV
jgi:hypothetical protein